ncbi:hypothetical protein O3M35_003094 [Rhynocoris fuscipes]|uniref:Uncharacterized protein n=1 Tax=Rhynocoris fuscipes TaxID=488301 RepID=A0AAW1CQE7_9HEMI
MRRLYQNLKSIVPIVTPQSCKFCVYHISRTALASLKIFFYYRLRDMVLVNVNSLATQLGSNQ